MRRPGFRCAPSGLRSLIVGGPFGAATITKEFKKGQTDLVEIAIDYTAGHKVPKSYGECRAFNGKIGTGDRGEAAGRPMIQCFHVAKAYGDHIGGAIMTMRASKIGTVPTEGFNWYIVLLEGPFADAIREQIDKYFITLGEEAGPEVLVVRGYNSTKFRNSFIESAAFYGPGDWGAVDVPAIVVTDALPTAVERRKGLHQARVMIFPLRHIYEKHKDISIFFAKLLGALQSSDASAALEKLDKAKIEKYWSWITDYVELKPGFFGFKADLGKIIGDMLAKAR